MKQFEYKLLTISVAHFKKEDFQKEINEKFKNWGEQGWELIKMEPITSGGVVFQGTSEFLVVFKREKQKGS
ncbi:MAG: DUF4177 domain-containing protein [Flavobacteriales bacterium]|nr:DUF4177 domain-containing protein [Flavobacteriales bacterium]